MHKHNRKNGRVRHFMRMLCAALILGILCLGVPSAALPADAVSKADLQAQYDALEQQLAKDKAALAEMKDDTEEAEAKKKNLQSQIQTLQSQIEVLTNSINEVQNEINDKQAEIAAKQTEIAAKEQEIASQWDDFKSRVAAMQEMRDSGTMAMLSTVQNLYELLTFPEMLQDISAKDTQILDNMKAEKADLEQAKADLEQAEADLEAKQADLEAKQKQMKSKQSELLDDYAQAKEDLADAQDAEAAQQALVDSDQMAYEAVGEQLAALIASAENSHSDLQFSGTFRCPLDSYTRISSTFGYRTLGGVTKMHPGVDYAAPAGTTIYAAADGYVTAAGWNSGGYGYYVLIYHGQVNGGDTYSTLYGHMLGQPSVSAGQYVTRGTAIGQVGSTGKSTGNHLHWEVWKGSTASNSVANKATRVNPLDYV